MLQKKNEGILFSAEIRVVGSYTDRLLIVVLDHEWKNNSKKQQKTVTKISLHKNKEDSYSIQNLSGLSLIRIRIHKTMSLYVIRGSQRPPRKLLAKNKQIRHPENTSVID